MILLKTIVALQEKLKGYRRQGMPVGFVPTMGALHEGHISLINACRANDDVCVCSIFVNPAQFNNAADFEKYPNTIESDIDMLKAAGCDILFMPAVTEIYPPGEVAQTYNLGYLETIFEGSYRPGHFQGVCRVVDKLLSILHPQNLYMGQKDYQQCMVVKKLIELKNYTTNLVIQPTIRQADGLAMSSRNMRLDADSKLLAVAINKTLALLKDNLKPGGITVQINSAGVALNNAGFKVDYVAIADAQTLVQVFQWDGHKKIVALAAAYLGDVRLIDNMLVN